MTYKNNVEDYLKVLNGKSFVKAASFADESKTLFISFYGSYQEFKYYTPKAVVSEESYNNYFGKGAKIEKLLLEETARLLMRFTYIDTVSMSLVFHDDYYDVNVNREKLNALIGFNIEDLSPEDGSWQEKFVNVYTTGFRNDRRKRLLENFMNVE